MKFTKMHGLGNDYVYVNSFRERVSDPARLARTVSNRHTGIGSDGLILIGPSQVADVRMEMFNADGSRAAMCGNGIRCVAKYAVEHGLASESSLQIETDAGVKRADCAMEAGRVRSVRVDMGKPILDPDALPSTISLPHIVDYALAVGDHEYGITCVSMGNPHAVVFVDHLDSVALDRVGPSIEKAAEFPERINAHFVRVDSPTHVTIRTWERGSGVTRACGSGACAVCVAGSVTERTKRQITTALPGGSLDIEWADNEHVYMTGPAEEVYTGVWPDDFRLQ